MAERRGKKTNHNKNFVAHKEWMEGKKLGRRKQIWVLMAKCSYFDSPEVIAATPVTGCWEKI